MKKTTQNCNFAIIMQYLNLLLLLYILLQMHQFCVANSLQVFKSILRIEYEGCQRHLEQL